MENEPSGPIVMITFFNSLVDSSHGGSYRMHEGITPLDQLVAQLFAEPGAIKFPLPETEAWTEKVYFLFFMVK